MRKSQIVIAAMLLAASTPAFGVTLNLCVVVKAYFQPGQKAVVACSGLPKVVTPKSTWTGYGMNSMPRPPGTPFYNSLWRCGSPVPGGMRVVWQTYYYITICPPCGGEMPVLPQSCCYKKWCPYDPYIMPTYTTCQYRG